MNKEVQDVDNNATENTETQTAKQNVEKTFTQTEFEDALKNEVARKTKGLPTKEELKEFNEWKESKKTEAEKQSETLKENASLKTRIAELENMNVVANAGVDSKFQKFVLSEVSTMEGDFEENLTNYLKDNQQFLVQKEEKKPSTTGFPQKNTNQGVSEEKAYLDKKYANNPYYKK